LRRKGESLAAVSQESSPEKKREELPYLKRGPDNLSGLSPEEKKKEESSIRRRKRKGAHLQKKVPPPKEIGRGKED